MGRYKNGLARIGAYYHYCFRMHGQQFKGSTRAADKATADKVLQEKRREALLRIEGGVQAVPTLEELLSLWTKQHQGSLSPRHIKNVRQLLATWVLPSHAKTRIDRLNTQAVLVIRTHMLAEGRSISTSNHLVRVLKLLANYALKAGFIPRLPFQVQQLRVQRKPRPVVPTSSVQEFLATLDQVTRDQQKRVAIRLMLGTGMRSSEVLGMRWEWLDAEQRTYTVGVAKGKEARVIPIPGWLWTALASLPRQLSPWVFPNTEGRQHFTSFLNQEVKATAEKLGIRGLTRHRLRATFASLHAEAGTPLTDIQGMLGHKQIGTTMIYVEQTLAAKRRAQDELTKRLGLV